MSPDDFFAGGRGGYEWLAGLLAGLGKDFEVGAAEGAHDSHDGGVGCKGAAQGVDVVGRLVVPLKVQSHDGVAKELCLLEVFQEPLGGALQLLHGVGIVLRTDHSHCFVYPQIA